MTRDRRGGTLPSMQTEPIHPAVRVGHVHLRVADLDRAIAFYHGVLGFGVQADGRAIGLPAAFLAAGDYHHHIGLNTFESAGATPPAGPHRALPRRLPVSGPARARPCGAAAARRGPPGRPRQRPRRDGVGLPRRPGRQRGRALLRPPALGVVRRRRAARCSRRIASIRATCSTPEQQRRPVPGGVHPTKETPCPAPPCGGPCSPCPPSRCSRSRPPPRPATTAPSGSSCAANRRSSTDRAARTAVSQDGAGPVTAASFTGVAGFKVTHGTGRYAKAHGRGLATFSEDAADHDRMTLVGRIAR